MHPVEAPPDATVFSSRGVIYYLYLGMKELRAIQRKWGLCREPGDTDEQYASKLLTFNIRLGTEEWEDRRDIMHACLAPWASAAGNGNGPVQVSDDEALRIFESAELVGAKKRRRLAPATRFAELWERFNLDASGKGPDDEADPAAGACKDEVPNKDPKVPPLPRGSTQSGS
jgi:hypothetical protein